MVSRAWLPAERRRQGGVTLVETLVAAATGALLLGGLMNVLSTSLSARDVAAARNETQEQARYAMERMVRAVQGAGRLLVPMADNPGTAWDESVRDPGVLAATLGRLIDRDANGTPDADNDGDGRVDEDPGADNTNDGASGIVGVDDDGDGLVDEGTADAEGKYTDNDEDGSEHEDPANGIDDDGDGSIDEDLPGDTSNDGAAGVAGVDDDGDGSVDEGNQNDDDEDGVYDEDGFEAVVFRLDAGNLIERVPVPWDQDGSGSVNGADFVERTVAAGVSAFRVARLPAGGGKPPLVRVELVLDAPDGEAVTLTRTVRAGGGR